MSVSSMSHVDFKKWPCRRVKFRGRGPYSYLPPEIGSSEYFHDRARIFCRGVFFQNIFIALFGAFIELLLSLLNVGGR